MLLLLTIENEHNAHTQKHAGEFPLNENESWDMMRKFGKGESESGFIFDNTHQYLSFMIANTMPFDV